MVLFLAVVFLLLTVDAVQVALLAGTDTSVSAAIAQRVDRIAQAAVADQPVAPEVVSTAAVPAGPGIYDLGGRIANRNTGWLGEAMTVHFQTSLGDTPAQTTFLLPANASGPVERLILLPHVAQPSFDAPQLIVDSVSWRRVSARDLEVLGGSPVIVTSTKLVPTTLENGAAATRAEIELKNPSVYGYRQVDVALSVERAGTVLAIRRTSTENLKSGGTATVVAVWDSRFPNDATLRVDPAVNPFDPAVRLPN